MNFFVAKSIEAFHQALSFINSYNSSPGYQNYLTPQEGVQFVSQFNNACYLRHSPVEGDVNLPQCFNQSCCGMQMDCLRCLSLEGVDLCAHEFNQSGTGLLIDCCKPDDVSKNHCLRQAVLTRLHRSHPGQEAMMTASEYLCWPFMNRQIIETCEKCRECTLFGNNLKPASFFNTAKSLPVLSGPNQELQLDFAGPLLDEKGSKIFLLVAIDRFSKFPSVLISKTTRAKKVTKFLDSYICIHGLPHSIRMDHGSGFKNSLVQEFCSNRVIKHILSPVGDHGGSGLVERSIQTIKRKLGVAKLDPNFKNPKDTIHHILEDIRKSNHSVLKKSPFELHFGRKPNTVWSQARNNVFQSHNSAQGLERNLLTPDQIASNDYSRDRAKVVPRGSSSPTLPTRFKPLFSLDENVADSEPYKALLGRQIDGSNSGVIFPQMEGNWYSRNSQPGIRTSPTLSNPVSTAILFASRQLPHLRGRKSAPGVHQLCNLLVSREQVN